MSSRLGTTPPVVDDAPAAEGVPIPIDFPSISRQSSSATHLASTASASPRRGGPLLSLKNLFGTSSKEKDNTRRLASVVSNDGSIRQGTWDGLSRNSPTDKRIDTMKQLHEVVRNRNLQVSTLEGLYHDTRDMLNDPDTKDLVLRMLIEVTHTQHSQLGLALRHTFFEDMDYLVADWVKETLNSPDHPQATLVLQLTQVLIVHNSAFIAQDSMTDIVKAVCIRACRTIEQPEPLTKDCLDVLLCVLKYSGLPRDQLMSVVSVFCIQVCNPTFREQAWTLARTLLTSLMGHRTRKHLQLLLEQGVCLSADGNIPELKLIRMLRGAVYCLANACWGTSQIDSMRRSPANIIPSMEIAMAADDTVCSDVLLALRRLIQKHGRDLQQMTWLKLIHLFEKAICLCEQYPNYAANCESSVQQLIMLTEQLYRDGNFCASADHLFDLVERCADRRPDSSVIALIEYRTGNITPLAPDWIENMLRMVKRYSNVSQVVERRAKVLTALHIIYTKWRMLYEHDLVTQLMLPVLSETASEKDPRIQYQMINVMFDVVKTVSLRGDCLLFESVVALIRHILNSSIVKALPQVDETEAFMDHSDRSNSDPRIVTDITSITMDNLLIMAKGVDEVLAERWKQLTSRSLNLLLDVMVKHIVAQYDAGWVEDQGSEVRAAVLSAILSVHCCPVTGRLQRSSRGDEEPQTNMFIRRRYESQPEAGFSWSEICNTVTMVVKHDLSWLVLRECLEKLGPVLENIELVRTATDEEVDALIQSLVVLYDRMDSERKDITASDTELAKYLPPVLATLLNYTPKQDNRNNEICRVLVACVRNNHMETLMAVDVAVQLAPQSMATMALILMGKLTTLEIAAKRALPLIEFMSDSAEVPEFHNFFRDAHFRMVVDILAPYTDVRQFNPYVVACIHRILMRWYAQITDMNMRQSIRCYIEEKVREAPFLSLTDSEGMHRQHSGDGRQVPGHLFLLGGDPSTPPPMDGIATFREARGPDIISDEVQRAMSAFFRLGRIEEDISVATSQRPDRLSEVSQEHYFVNDTIISIITLIERKEDEGDNDVFAGPGDPQYSPPSSIDSTEFRRRHQSAVHDRRAVAKALQSVHQQPKALDDLYAPGGPHQQRRNTITKIPTVAFTQLVVRHMYGKSSWMMRSLEDWPEDFERTTSISQSSCSLLFHLINTPGAVKLKGNRTESTDDTLQLALRNLDRLLGIELHAVGVMYVGPGQITEPDILANTYGSERYSRFVKLLGDPITLERFPGGLQPGLHGNYTYEYKDELSRIVFLIATLMPNNDPSCNSKKKLIGNNFVTVVFNESGKPFKLGTVCRQFALVAIEVIPCSANNVLLTVHARQEISCWMAMKRVLLCDESAAKLVRKLIVRSQLSVNVWRSEPTQPYISSGVDRLRKILEIREKMSTSTSILQQH